MRPAFILAIVLLLPTTRAQARSASHPAVLVLAPGGPTSQLHEEDAEAIRDIVEQDVLAALPGYTTVSDRKLRKALKKASTDDDEDGGDALQIANKAGVQLLVVGMASSARDKHTIAWRVILLPQEIELAAANINGKNIDGLKRSWSRKKDEMFTDLAKVMSAASQSGGSSRDAEEQIASVLQDVAKQDKKTLKQQCDSGNAAACTGRGYLYLTGNGVRKNRSYGAYLVQKGCDGGDGSGCLLLAKLYSTGTGVPEDRDKAVTYVRTACKDGVQKACDLLPKEGPKNAY
jgi:TPR repeat protein